MFRLRIGYLIAGIVTGLSLLFSFLWTLPDGKLHIVFCNVGQGDGAYVRFPDGRDMVVDGGPDDKILGCLGRHMPFWDRQINIVVMTHPQKDHMQGLIPILERYNVDYFVRSDIYNTTEGYNKLLDVIASRKVPVKFVTTGEQIAIGSTSLSMLWPSADQIAKGKALYSSSPSGRLGVNSSRKVPQDKFSTSSNNNVLGAAIGDLNDYCIVFLLRYGSFDALFTGDADSHVESNYTGVKLARLGSAPASPAQRGESSSRLADDTLEVLKVPHHGSKTGMTKDFVNWLHPKLSIISVGKNSYGHPSSEALELLKEVGSDIKRTDEEGDIEVVSDGKNWNMFRKNN